MHHKNILLVSRTSRHHDRMRELSHALDVSIALATPATFSQAISSGHEFDLVILDPEGIEQSLLNSVDSFVSDNGFIPMLFIAEEDKLARLHLPVQGRNDFILATAGEAEFEVRCSLLLWPGEESAPADIVTIDNMTINLATYQVYIDSQPVDLTLMEYSLLSFLATHPSRAYSREDAPAPRVGLRVLRRHAYRRRAHPSRPFQGRPAGGCPHRDGPRRRLPLQALGAAPIACLAGPFGARFHVAGPALPRSSLPRVSPRLHPLGELPHDRPLGLQI